MSFYVRNEGTDRCFGFCGGEISGYSQAFDRYTLTLALDSPKLRLVSQERWLYGRSVPAEDQGWGPRV